MVSSPASESQCLELKYILYCEGHMLRSVKINAYLCKIVYIEQVAATCTCACWLDPSIPLTPTPALVAGHSPGPCSHVLRPPPTRNFMHRKNVLRFTNGGSGHHGVRAGTCQVRPFPSHDAGRSAQPERERHNLYTSKYCECCTPVVISQRLTPTSITRLRPIHQMHIRSHNFLQP